MKHQKTSYLTYTGSGGYNEPVGALDLVLGGGHPVLGDAEDAVVVLVLHVLGVEAAEVLEVVLELDLLLARVVVRALLVLGLDLRAREAARLVETLPLREEPTAHGLDLGGQKKSGHGRKRAIKSVKVFPVRASTTAVVECVFDSNIRFQLTTTDGVLAREGQTVEKRRKKDHKRPRVINHL